MQNDRNTFKKPPKKYQPKGLSILYEDRDILVVDKASGLLTISSETDKRNTAYYRLTDYVRKGNKKSKNRLFIVHRLDKDTSGVIVFAKSHSAKRHLQGAWPEFQKTYFAVVNGVPEAREGVITSYLAENSSHKVYSVPDSQKGRIAKTGYRVIQESSKHSLLEIDLLTGRKNQIRVHLADEGCPVVGDRKYGIKDSRTRRLALHAAEITISHPHSKESRTFTAELPVYFNMLIKGPRELQK